MGVRVDGAAGPLALGAKGSVRDRLTPPGRVEGSRPRELYSIAALARYGAFAPFFIPPLAAKTIQPPCGRGNAFPLWWLAPPPCPVGSMSLDSRVAYSSPMNPVPLPPPQAGALWMLSNGAMSLQESIEQFILPPLADRGALGAASQSAEFLS